VHVIVYMYVCICARYVYVCMYICARYVYVCVCVYVHREKGFNRLKFDIMDCKKAVVLFVLGGPGSGVHSMCNCILNEYEVTHLCMCK